MDSRQPYIANCSFGKDSIAAILVSLREGIRIDRVVYCRIMFNDEISAELPEHERWIHSTAIPLLKGRYGLDVDIVQPKESYSAHFFRAKKKGPNTGKIYGFPGISIGPWCNGDLKRSPMEKYYRRIGNHIKIIGIAADETRRIENKVNQAAFLPLVKYGVTEKDAFQICEDAGLLSPAYDETTRRLGCWFCNRQRVGEMRKLRGKHPELWGRLLKMDKHSPHPFIPRATLTDFDKRFSKEYKQIDISDLPAEK